MKRNLIDNYEIECLVYLHESHILIFSGTRVTDMWLKAGGNITGLSSLNLS